MALDPRKFHSMLVTDTCSIWHLLSSRKLFRSARSSNRHFFITPMVQYECLSKSKTTLTPERVEMINRFKSACNEGVFPMEGCDLDDLLIVGRGAPVGLSSGELSCIATAYKMKTVAIMTDDRQARRYAEETLRLVVETTPKLYAWLHYHRHLSDGDHSDVIAEHERYERRPLTRFFCEAYEAALQCRLMDRGRSESQIPDQG